MREQGVTRYDLGREKFLDKVWEWKDEYAATIREQWGKLGLSLDYQRDRFTLDEGLSKAVRKVFVELYKKAGSTVANLSSTGTQQLAQLFQILKLFTRT